MEVQAGDSQRGTGPLPQTHPDHPPEAVEHVRVIDRTCRPRRSAGLPLSLSSNAVTKPKVEEFRTFDGLARHPFNWQGCRNVRAAMAGHAARISLADLSAAGIRLRASDAATIARELVLRATRGVLPGIPSLHVIRLCENGDIHIEGPVASGREIERAARLLESLLPSFDAPPELRVPGALRLVVARALRILDLPPYESAESFAEALERFALPHTRGAVQALVASWRDAIHSQEEADVVESDGEDVAPPLEELPVSGEDTAELTISDIRRARRATRLTLRDVSDRTRIPVDLLREFEWGYLANWPRGFKGYTQIVQYARAADLDEKVVIRAALPLLDQWESRSAPEPKPAQAALENAPPGPGTSLVKVAPRPLAVHGQKANRRRVAWAAALAIPALITIGAIPALWNSQDDDTLPIITPQRRASVEREPAVTVSGRNTSAAIEAPPTPAVPEPMVRNAAFSPAFATVGSAMFYHSSSGSESAIMRADTDARGAVMRVTRVIDDNASNFHARPSPDGAWIAFDSDRDGERGVYVADANGRNVRRVSGDGFAAVPSWSPDGTQLAFVRAEPGRPKVWNIWILDVASGTPTRVTSHTFGQPWGAAWFPDGRRIAYSHEDRLTIRALDGSHRRTFESPVRGRMVRTPAVSPDGSRIIFQVHRDGAWLLDVASRRMRKILNDASAEEFTWSPDGRRVAYHSRHSGQWGVWAIER